MLFVPKNNTCVGLQACKHNVQQLWALCQALLGCCRDFKRAAAAGDELNPGVVDKLLEVLSKGDSPYLVTSLAQAFRLAHRLSI